MRRDSYRAWLAQKYDSAVAGTRISHANRVEQYYGDLDDHYERDRLEDVIFSLRYSTHDKRRGFKNPSKIPFDGDVYNNLASYRGAVDLYRRFRDSIGSSTFTAIKDGDAALASDALIVAEEAVEELGASVGLERDMQAALRKAIDQLEPGLEIIDNGAERFVESGFIDITARDATGAIVAIELKTGTAGQRAVAQILSYMGDLALEEPDAPIKGILIAAEFDKKARAAARVSPSLSLKRYGVRFHFSNAGD